MHPVHMQMVHVPCRELFMANIAAVHKGSREVDVFNVFLQVGLRSAYLVADSTLAPAALKLLHVNTEVYNT